MSTVQRSVARVKPAHAAKQHHEHVEAGCLADWHTARAMARKLHNKPDLHALALRVIRYLSPYKHSKDYAAIIWNGIHYRFTGTQAAIVRCLWRARLRGTLDVRQETLIDAAGCSETSKMSNVFKDHPAWTTVISTDRLRGVYRLATVEYDPPPADMILDAGELAGRLLAKYADRPVSMLLSRIVYSTRPEDVFVPSHMQRGILDALNGKALRTDALASKVGSRSRIFRRDGIHELRHAGLVSHHKRIGYFRPDAPPPELAK